MDDFRSHSGLYKHITLLHFVLCSKPVCLLYGHTSPILSVHIAEAEEKIYTIAFDNCVKVSTYILFITHTYTMYVHNKAFLHGFHGYFCTLYVMAA